ncbi:MVP1 [Mytilus edulis]|uniref:SNX8 n=1 Tax=Mytilus edulis TaxID=6550 RepID=A0A8S3V4B8_MYTED|nr:MVP1 [Mytilus edulis]
MFYVPNVLKYFTVLKIAANREFIEQRRKSLRRFCNLVARHPKMYDDKLVKFFLTFSGSDMTNKIKEVFRGIPDEFMTSNLASKAKELVPMDTQQQIQNSKEHMRMLYNGVTKMKDISEKLVMRATGYACDMLQFGQELSSFSNDATSVSAWATGRSETWHHLKKGFKHLSVEYAALGDKAAQEAGDTDSEVVEKLCLFQDLLLAYKAGTVEQLEQKILEQESQIANMENRNYFSLHCLQMETQLIHANLEILYDVLGEMAVIQAKSHSEIGKVWSEIKPIVDNLHGRDSSRPNSPTRTSPIGSPMTSSGGGLPM